MSDVGSLLGPILGTIYYSRGDDAFNKLPLSESALNGNQPLWLPRDCTSKMQHLRFEKQFSDSELARQAPELALDHALGIFEQFNWHNMRSSETAAILRDEQKKLLGKRL